MPLPLCTAYVAAICFSLICSTMAWGCSYYIVWNPVPGSHPCMYPSKICPIVVLCSSNFEAPMTPLPFPLSSPGLLNTLVAQGLLPLKQTPIQDLLGVEFDPDVLKVCHE